MKKYQFILILLIIIILTTACENQKIKEEEKEKKETEEKVEEPKMELAVKMTIDNDTYHVTLEDNETTKEFMEMLPLTLEMKDLNNNEKYYYLDKDLPTNSYNPDIIKKGDIMIYGKNCFVIFYETFETDYNYTKIGHIKDLKEFEEEDIIVKIEKE